MKEDIAFSFITNLFQLKQIVLIYTFKSRAGIAF